MIAALLITIVCVLMIIKFVCVCNMGGICNDSCDNNKISDNFV